MGIKKIFVSITRKSRALLVTPALEKVPSTPNEGNKAFSKGLPESPVAESASIKSRLRAINFYTSPFQISIILGVLFILLFVKYTIFVPFEGADSPQCRSIYMFPSYARMDGFDLRYNALAQKYHIYLYREQGLDTEPLDGGTVQLDGIPVLFIPGNAGSFKQVRSIAASCSQKYFLDRDSISNSNTRNLDFFAADFNEDYTAFHGRTMLDQAEYLNDAIRYILSLYETTSKSVGPTPSSVIVIGHSMGGIVARILPTLKNHVEGSIQSLITLSSPHAAAPVTFDGDILKIYARTNDFWREQIHDNESFMSRNLSLISITGGILDMMLPADYTAIEDILPLENGFTTYSSTIPNVWTPIDHLAVVWCDQLRKKLAELLLETVDFTVPSKVLPLKERMKISRNYLLTGFENYTMQDLLFKDSPLTLHGEDFELAKDFSASDHPSTISMVTKETTVGRSKFLKIPLSGDIAEQRFTFLSSAKDRFRVRFCMQNRTHIGAHKGTLSDDCYLLLNEMKSVPASSKITGHASDSSMGSDIEPFEMLSLGCSILTDYDYIILEKVFEDEFDKHDFAIYELESSEPEISIDVSPLQIAAFGFDFDLPDKLSQTIKFPYIWDSLLSYRFHISIVSENLEEPLFQPFVRQWIEDPFESKWHVNITDGEFNINMHNVAPFIPLEETHDRSLKLTFIMPPGISLKGEIKLNWTLTLKMLFIRFRLVFLSIPVSIISFVLAYQLKIYHKSRVFPDFNAALATLMKLYGARIIFTLLILSPIVNTKLIQRILFVLDPIRLNRPFLLDKQHMHTNFYFLGIRSWYLSGFGLLFEFISIAALYLIAQLHQFIESALHYVQKKFLPPKVTGTVTAKVSQNINPWNPRFITCVFLLTAVFFYIPYQLASAISLVIQTATCLRVSTKSSVLSSVEYSNLRNYNYSIFLLLLFVMFINCPVIIVFLHNVAIRWETPFRSHHNFLAVAPVIFLVSFNSNLKMPSFKFTRAYEKIMMISLLVYLGLFSLLYGARNLYWIPHLVNIFCAWFLYCIFANSRNDT